MTCNYQTGSNVRGTAGLLVALVFGFLLGLTFQSIQRPAAVPPQPDAADLERSIDPIPTPRSPLRRGDRCLIVDERGQIENRYGTCKVEEVQGEVVLVRPGNPANSAPQWFRRRQVLGLHRLESGDALPPVGSQPTGKPAGASG